MICKEPVERRADLELLCEISGLEVSADLAARWHREQGLHGLRGREAGELADRWEMPRAAAERLVAAVELGRRMAKAAIALPEPIRGGRDVYRFLAPRFAASRVECFHALYLDAKGRRLDDRRISEGTLTTSLVHPREVFAPAILHRAAALVVAHNHPSGDPEPSHEDRNTNRRLERAGRLLGIQLLDHIILGAGCYFSFLESGELAP